MLVVDLVLFLGACIGHAALLTFSSNWWYGQALDHHVQTVVRMLHGLLILAGIVTLTWLYLLHYSVFVEMNAGGWKSGAVAYVLTCCIIGLVVVPLETIRRHRTARPAVLASNHTSTVDFAARLGYKPIGRGQYRLLTRLPGNEVFRVDFSERVLRLPKLPAAWDGLSILHLSDMHLRGNPDKVFFQQVMDLCRDWNPDLLAITGDIVDSETHHRWVIPVLGRLRWSIAGLAILGNHDSWFEHEHTRRRLRRLGLRVLGNGWQQIEVRGEPLVVIGHEAPWFKPEPNLADCPRGPFRLCLSHTPDHIAWARRNAIDLMLAGHVHGGQIRFPVLGSMFVPSRYGRRYDCGTFHEPPTVMHVSRGLSGKQPLRYNCRPEVTKIVLKAN